MKHLLSYFLLLTSFSSFAQLYHIQENFNDTTLPLGWNNTAISGNYNWKFGVDGSNGKGSFPGEMGDNNIDGTPMAIFDDDSLGQTHINNTAELKTPIFDNSKDVESTLEFDYNFRSITPIVPNIYDSLYVEVYDGKNWWLILSVTDDDCGQYISRTGAPIKCITEGFPHAKINLDSYKNDSCQIRFRYHDGNDWAFYAAIDNVTVSHLDSNNIGVASILHPNDSCGLTSSESVRLQLINNGINTISGFEVTVDLNNGSQIVTETVNDTLKYQDTLIYDMVTPLNFYKVGKYNIKAYTTYALDTLGNNDTAYKTIRNGAVVKIPHIESFESANHGWKTSSSSIEWGIPQGRRIDHASDSLRVFASNLNGNAPGYDTSYLISPCFHKDEGMDAIHISFDLFLDISLHDQLNLEYSLDHGISWINIVDQTISKNWYNISRYDSTAWNRPQQGWQSSKNTIKGLIGYNQIIFRFVFKTGSYWFGSNIKEGFAMDNFTLSYPYLNDLALNQVTYPVSETSDLVLERENPVVEFYNLGTTPVDSFEVSYALRGFPKVTEKVIDSIAPLSSYSYTFNDSIDLSDTSLYELTFEIKLLGDQNINNNELFHFIDNRDQRYFNVPYRETFDSFQDLDKPSYRIENLKDGWQVENRNIDEKLRWKVGEAEAINTKYEYRLDFSRNNIFYIRQANSSDSYQHASIISPFIQLDSSSNTILSFWYYRRRIKNRGAGTLWIDIYDGKQWHLKHDSITGPLPSVLRPFEEKRVQIGSFANRRIKVRFRYIFNSVFYHTTFGIDDFSINSGSSEDIKLRLATVFKDSCDLSQSYTLITELENNGALASDSIFVFHQLNKLPIVRDTVLKSIPADSTDYFVIPDPIIPNGQIENTLKVWIVHAGDQNRSNDTIEYEFKNYGISLPHLEDFEDYALRGCQNTIHEIKENTHWDNSDWGIMNHLICNANESNQLPLHSTSSLGNQYLASNVSNNYSQTLFSSQCIALKSTLNPVFSFDYHKVDSLSSNLYIDINSTGSWVALDSIKGKQQVNIVSDWKHKKIDLSAYKDQNVFLRLRAERFLPQPWLNFSTHSVSLDNLYLYYELKQDVALVDLLQPNSKCDLSNAEDVTIQLKNNGDSNISVNSITASLLLNDAVIATESIPDSLVVDSFLNYTFSHQLDLSDIYTQYVVRVELSLIGDSNLIDNTISNQLVQSSTKNPGYIEDFENFGRGLYGENWERSASNQTGPDQIQAGWHVSPNSVSDRYHWNVQSPSIEEADHLFGGTPTLLTGPATNHTPEGNTFFYTEADSGSWGDTALLTFKCLDLSNLNTGSLQFWYHKFGKDIGDLYIDVYANNQWNLAIDSIMGQTHFYHLASWQKRIISLNSFAGKEVQIRFRAIRGNGIHGDMAIDDVHIFDSLTVRLEEIEFSENKNVQELNIYPNPTKGSFNIRLSSDMLNQEFFIIDLNGKLLRKEKADKNLLQINLNSLNRGVYFIRFPKLGITKKIVLF